MNQPMELEVPNVLSQRIIKRHYKILGNSVINSLLSPLSLMYFSVLDQNMLVKGLEIICLIFSIPKMAAICLQIEFGVFYGSFL